LWKAKCVGTCTNMYKRASQCYPDNHCKVGCICDEGYVYDKHYKCIPISSCPGPKTTTPAPTLPPECAAILCPVGSKCGCPPPCPATCQNPDPVSCSTPSNCTVQCYGVCKQGYILDKLGGKCVPLGECPGYCILKHNYEQYYECSTKDCQRTCKQPNPTCTEECKQPGNWDCSPGYVRQASTGKCVYEKQCNRTGIWCPSNEIWYPYSTRGCERTCKRPNPYCVAKFVEPGNCDCKPPLVRDTKTCQCVHRQSPRCYRQVQPEYWYENLFR